MTRLALRMMSRSMVFVIAGPVVTLEAVMIAAEGDRIPCERECVCFACGAVVGEIDSGESGSGGAIIGDGVAHVTAERNCRTEVGYDITVPVFGCGDVVVHRRRPRSGRRRWTKSRAASCRRGRGSGGGWISVSWGKRALCFVLGGGFAAVLGPWSLVCAWLRHFLAWMLIVGCWIFPGRGRSCGWFPLRMGYSLAGRIGVRPSLGAVRC
jgi:hypothetical protein